MDPFEQQLKSFATSQPGSEVDSRVRRAIRSTDAAGAIRAQTKRSATPISAAHQTESAAKDLRILDKVALVAACVLVVVALASYVTRETKETGLSVAEDPVPVPQKDKKSADEETLEILLLQLTSDDFATREAAMKGLMAAEERAIPLLKRKLAEATDADLKDRLNRLIARWTPGGVLWRAEIQEFPEEGVVADGSVFITNNHHLYSLNSETGLVNWSFSSERLFLPAYHNKRIYVASFLSGDLFCLDAETGSIFWKQKGEPGGSGALSIANGHIYFVNNRMLQCLDAGTGKKKWDYNAKEFTGTPAIADGRVYLGSGDKNVYCFDAVTGAEHWRFTTGAAASFNAAISRGLVVVQSEDGNLYCLDSKTGAKIWQCEIGKVRGSAPAIVDERVVIGAAEKLHCLSLKDGAKLWEYPSKIVERYSPAFADDRVLIATETGMSCLDLTNGKEIWEYHHGSQVGSHPIVLNDIVYAACVNDNQIVALRLGKRSKTQWPMFRGNLARTGCNDPELPVPAGK